MYCINTTVGLGRNTKLSNGRIYNLEPQMLQVVKCKECGKLEYYGMIHWKSGKQMCRECIYKVWRNSTWQPKEGRDFVFPLYEDGEVYGAAQALKVLHAQQKLHSQEQLVAEGRATSVEQFADTLGKVKHIGKATQLSIATLYQVYLKWSKSAISRVAYRDLGTEATRIIFTKQLKALGFTKDVRPIGRISVNVFLGVVIVDMHLLVDYNYYETLRLLKKQ